MPLVSSFNARRFSSKGEEGVEDVLTNEAALQILVNNKPFSVTMRTQGHEADLVRGLLFAEKAYDNTTLKSPFRFQTNELDELGCPSVVNVTLDPEELGSGFDSKRTSTSVSSCGICGKEDLSAIELCGNPLQDPVKFKSSDISTMFETMAKAQDAFNSSGGCHAAAAFNTSLEMMVLMEDIGRHNAVDKVIGNLLNNNRLHDAKVILVSGRVSYEIVSKAYFAGIPILAAISAPSSLAVSTSRHFGLTLLGFCRGDKATAYSVPERLVAGTPN